MRRAFRVIKRYSYEWQWWSQKETADRKMEVLSTKCKTRIGFWNVRMMYKTGKLAQATSELRRYNLHVLGISERRWTGSGRESAMFQKRRWPALWGSSHHPQEMSQEVLDGVEANQQRAHKSEIERETHQHNYHPVLRTKKRQWGRQQGHLLRTASSRAGEHTTSWDEDCDGRYQCKGWKWQQELWKGHGERRMSHHEWQWREANGHVHHLWFCHWKDAYSTPRCPQADLVLPQWKRQEPDWPLDDQRDVKVITASRPSEKRSWCGKWPPPCDCYTEAEAKEDRIQSKRVTTLWCGEVAIP